jgi:hypothetical protein
MGGVIMATKQEWHNILINTGCILFPDSGDRNGKTFFAGYTQAKQNNPASIKDAKSIRNKIVKDLRSDGWQTWTEPESHMGGTDTVEFAFSCAKGIS